MRGFRRRRQPQWGVTTDLTIPPWYPLDLGVEPSRFRAVVERALRDADPWSPMDAGVAEATAAEIAGWAATLRSVPGILDAAVLRPSVEGPVEAVLSTSLSSPPASVTLEEFVEEHLGDATYDLTEEALPVGEALRVHRAGRSGDDETSVEAVGYAFRAPDGDVVWHEMFWAGTGEHRWCDTADALARGLTFT